ncbi:MAG: ATP-dependent helicase [Lachnospiraceae bacterium]|nr:ATP-dependent helicase [Lachnospiraceae bacterium]
MDKRTLSAEQLEAVEHCYGPKMVIAGPGSGKTFVITKRLEHMIKAERIRPEDILVITFTKAAAVEMQTRFMALMKDEASLITFGTFHSVFFGILKRTYNYTAADILTEKAKYIYLKSVISVYPDINDDMIDSLISKISKIKNDGIRPEKFDDGERLFDKDTFCRIFYDYGNILKAEGKLDFDDMVLLCRKLFLNEPDILDHWRNRYKYILIDEFQDINPMQYEVVRMLSAPANNLFVVGDDDQSIYGFRGSRPEIMLGFKKEYPDATITILSDNFRSRDGIVRLAGTIISNNKERFDKKLKAVKKGGESVAILPFDERQDESNVIIELINSAKKHISFDDMAVICRTNTGAARYSGVLSAAGIPFVLKEKVTNIFTTPEAQDILSMFSYAHGERTRSNLLRFMNKPARYIRRCDLEEEDYSLEDLLTNPELKDYVKKNIRGLIYDLEKLKDMHPYAGINYIRKGIGYENYLLSEGKKRGKSRDDILELLDRISDTTRNVDDYFQWREWINEYDDMICESTQKKKAHGVCLTTMHGSKGLEYSLVILPDINEGNVPWKKCETAEEIEEERRVFYVAVTRAKEKLVLCYLKKNTENKVMPSRFLRESGLI